MRTKLLVMALVAAIVGLLAAAVPAGASNSSARPAPVAKTARTQGDAHSVPAAAGGLTPHYKKVSPSSMPAAARAALKAAHLTVSPNATVYIAELVSLQYGGKCVDANNYGATAGQNGDKVQLWGCFNDYTNHPNQWWWPLQTAFGETELVNWQYPGMCLDADSSGGFVNGAKVQLWGCFNDYTNHPNQWWNYGPTGSYTQLPLLWGSNTKVLDVNDYGPSAGQDGDKIQIWQYLGGNNQYWKQ